MEMGCSGFSLVCDNRLFWTSTRKQRGKKVPMTSPPALLSHEHLPLVKVIGQWAKEFGKCSFFSCRIYKSGKESVSTFFFFSLLSSISSSVASLPFHIAIHSGKQKFQREVLHLSPVLN